MTRLGITLISAFLSAMTCRFVREGVSIAFRALCTLRAMAAWGGSSEASPRSSLRLTLG